MDKKIVKIAPFPGKQEMFLASEADIVIYGGSAGGGKSFCLCLEFIRHSHNPRFGAVIFRRTSTQIRGEGGLWSRSEQIYPYFKATPRESVLCWDFPSGARVQFAHLEHEKSKYNWDGTEIPYLAFDELIHFTESQFFYLLSRNRSTCGVKPYVRATTNPDSGSWVAKFIEWWIDQDSGYPIEKRSGVLRWFYRIDNNLVWYDSKKEAMEANPKLAENAEPKSLTFIPAKLEDNPALNDGDPGYRATLLALSTVERERLYKGNWKIKAEAGKVFNRAFFKIIDALPRGDYDEIRSWDKAGTESGEGAETAGVKMYRYNEDGRFVISDVVHGRWSALQRENVIKNTAQMDGEQCPILIEQEPGSGGKESAENTIRMLAGFRITAKTASGDKVTRALPFSAQVEAGNVCLLKGDWNEFYINQLHNFPDGDLKDCVDASSAAFNWLASYTNPKDWWGTWQAGKER